MPTVNVNDAGGIFDGSAFPATATVTGVVRHGRVASASLEGASPTLAYYSGTFTSTSTRRQAPPLSAPTHAGAYTVVATFAGTTDYATATRLTNFTIAQATPQFAWAAPAAITYGTPLVSRATRRLRRRPPGVVTPTPRAPARSSTPAPARRCR